MASVSNVDGSMVDYLKTVDTPTLSNAIEMLQVRQRNERFASCRIRCLFPELGPMVGYAMTAHVESMTRGIVDCLFFRLYEAVEHARKPAIVVFQELGPLTDYAMHCGETMATVFKRLGAIGLVSDCAVRDIAAVRALRFHFFAAGAVASHAYFRIVRIGIPIQLQGMVVCPGDLLHGDENGVITVPTAGLGKLPELVETVRLKERNEMEFVRSSEFTLERLKVWHESKWGNGPRKQ